MSITVRQRLEQDRRDLLDLGMRNPLLNFRELKGRGARVVDELSEEVYRILVVQGRQMSFVHAPEPRDEGSLFSDEQDEAFEQPDDDRQEPAERHTDQRLQTPYTGPVLQRRLLNSYYLSRTYLEERGVNVLYLTLGMLHWYEAPQSKDERLAPILLVPVSLRRLSASSRFKISYTGGQVASNLCQSVKLRNDFGIQVPTLSEEDDVDISGYLEATKKSVQEMDRWRVDPNEIHLGFLSFTKLLMYEDLDPEKWPEQHKPHEHPILRAVLGEGFPAHEPLPDAMEPLDRRVQPESTFQVVDADSSQTVAIEGALQGRNMVIQGPPGTGKSQTITNLIAEAVAAGKKVLFVAEKMAALEVVKRRLDNVGLGDCCIEIHSHNTNKRDFLQELSRTLNLGRPPRGEREGLARSLGEARDRLNAYARAVSEPIGLSGVSPYGAVGRLLAAQDALEDLDQCRMDRSNFQSDSWTPDDVARRETLLRSVAQLLDQMGRPKDHPFVGSAAETFVPTRDRQEIEESSQEALDRSVALDAALDKLATKLGVLKPSSLVDAQQLLASTRLLLEAPPLQQVKVQSGDWIEEAERLEEAVAAGEQIRATQGAHVSVLLPHAWVSEVLPIRNAIAAHGRKWWRLLSGDYRRAQAELAGLWEGRPPRAYEEQLKALDAILLVRRLREDLHRLSGLLTELYGRPVDGAEEDWRRLGDVFKYLKNVHQEVAARSLPRYMVDLLEREWPGSQLQPLLSAAERADDSYRAALTRARRAAKFVGDVDEEATFEGERRALESWGREPGRLQEIATFNHATQELEDAGLAALVAPIVDWKDGSRGILHVFRAVYYGGLLERAQFEHPVLKTFDGSRHGAVVDDFRKADRGLLESNRVAVAHSHWKALPSLEGVGQVGVLTYEMNKKRRHKPIRQLMSEAGRAIQAIKPIFMMSPLSIASFIPPGSLDFDLVVFDEASQVRPVDAYGALLRGKQAVVVGDSRQLPPTSFFEASLEGDEEGEEAAERASDVESILGLFEARGAFPSMLQWHYRSRHESLIALSNQEFYDGRLKVFPSPDAERESVGLLYHHLEDTHYERGRGRSYNRGEAKQVARAAMEHARRRPDLTLGVAAFSQAQMDILLDELEILRRSDPSCEAYFNSHPEEPFFVKNLENVQGDERDVIFISVGYGRTEEGYLSMNFGPLNRDGGERRLNVLITRARRRCEVFTNLRADDIDLQRASGRGVVAFQRFLRYAEQGILDLPGSNSDEADSDFERVVAEFLRQHGHTVEHQIGSAGFSIDLGIRDPVSPGRYLIGIECDGATYHSARWARDRDRLRQEVLENQGWRIHRIWSTDWFYNREREQERLLAEIEKAQLSSRAVTPERQDRAPHQEARFGIPRESNRTEDSNHDRESSLPLYEVAEPVVKLGGALFEERSERIAGWVAAVVAVESPVHISEVIGRVANSAGYERAGKRIRGAVEGGVRTAVRSGDVRLDSEGFLWKPSMTTPTPRDRSRLPVGSRKLEFVSPAEIEALLKSQAVEAHGAQEGELISAVCRLLGFGRVSAAMNQQVFSSVEALVRTGELRREGSLLVASRQA